MAFFVRTVTCKHTDDSFIVGIGNAKHKLYRKELEALVQIGSEALNEGSNSNSAQLSFNTD